MPVEYFEAVCRAVPIMAVTQLKFYAPWWASDKPPEPLWMEARAKHYFLLGGGALRNRCAHFQEMVTSLKHRFCPFCGNGYKSEVVAESHYE